VSIGDPIAAAKKQEETDRSPFIVIQEFWIEYDPQSDGSMKPVEFVKWAKRGVQNAATTVEKIARLQKYPDNDIWKVIRPYYEAWKAGEAAPVTGIPLEAWPGATPQLVKALAPANIRSVEDLARLEDSAIQRLAIPDLRRKQAAARSYLEARKSTAEVEADNQRLRSELDEVKALVASLMADRQTEDAPKKRRGRPPKEAQAA
jgi:hypothetical protein